MQNSQLLNFLLSLVSVRQNIFEVSEERDQKLLIAFSIFVYVSCALGGYSCYVSVYFLLQNFLLAFLLALFTTGFLILHDQSILATERTGQIVSKLFISLVLAAAFTLTNTATKEYDTLKSEIVAETEYYNAEVRITMNAKLDEIENEERAILVRIEEASQVYDQTRKSQRLIDSRRSLKKFEKTKQQRIDRIKDTYKSKFKEPQISDLTILSLQTKKILQGDEGALVTVLLGFIFLLLESLPVIIRLALRNDGDYMTRYLTTLFVNRDLRDQKIRQQKEFTSEKGNLIKCLLTMNLLKQKRQAILSDFANHDELIILDKRMKILAAGYNPYTGEDLNHVDLDIFSKGTEEKKEEKSKASDNESPKKEEPVFPL